jgi:hypothetical protein
MSFPRTLFGLATANSSVVLGGPWSSFFVVGRGGGLRASERMTTSASIEFWFEIGSATGSRPLASLSVIQVRAPCFLTRLRA